MFLGWCFTIRTDLDYVNAVPFPGRRSFCERALMPSCGETGLWHSKSKWPFKHFLRSNSKKIRFPVLLQKKCSLWWIRKEKNVRRWFGLGENERESHWFKVWRKIGSTADNSGAVLASKSVIPGSNLVAASSNLKTFTTWLDCPSDCVFLSLIFPQATKLGLI